MSVGVLFPRCGAAPVFAGWDMVDRVTFQAEQSVGRLSGATHLPRLSLAGQAVRARGLLCLERGTHPGLERRESELWGMGNNPRKGICPERYAAT
jgi:hypothetical protein